MLYLVRSALLYNYARVDSVLRRDLTLLGPELLKTIFFVLLGLAVLFLLSTLADDMHMQIARFHDYLDQKTAATRAYKRVVEDFTNNLEDAKAALRRLDPEYAKTSPLMKRNPDRRKRGK